VPERRNFIAPQGHDPQFHGPDPEGRNCAAAAMIYCAAT